MAMTTARRSEPHSSPKLRSDLDDNSRSPLRITHPPTSRTSTPRPSISPLSVASKANKGSPIATRDATMAATELHAEAEADNAVDIADAEVGEQEDDGSSSLSEPDDDQDDAYQHETTVASTEDVEQLAAQQSVEVDSEAETERLEQTPQKLRRHSEDIGKTPSKLSQAATAEDELSEPPSPLPMGPGAASSTSTIATGGKKRKRSDTAESPLTSAESDIGESPRKRSHEFPPEPDVNNDDDENAANGVAESAIQETVERTPLPYETRGTPMAFSGRGGRGRKGKQKGRKPKDTIPEPEQEPAQDAAGPDDEASEETGAKTEEQRLYKTKASSMYEEVTKQFMAFREKLYNERLATMNAELNLLAQPNCSHPEYLRQVAGVDARLEKQTREAHAYYHYRLKSIKDRTLGDRSQLHSQYFQSLRDQRENILYRLAEDWHNIQKERRQSHQEKDEAYVYKFQAKKSVQIRQQAKYNQEVSVLSGIAKYVGFPAAPDIAGAEGENLEEDFKAMKIPKRVLQPTAHAHTVYLPRPSVTVPTQTHSDREAHQQYIEQNAWAQPQRPIHHHGTPNLTHTPDWAEPGPHSSARNLIRNLSGQTTHRVNSPFTTPMPQKRAAQADGAEPPSSVFAAPPTSDRIQFLHQGSSNATSPLTITKQRQQQNGNGPPPGGGERELTGFRNISNLSHLSGASTIDASSSPPPPVASSTESPEERRHVGGVKQLPALSTEVSAPLQGFDTSQLHRHGQYTHGHGEDGGGRRERDMREVYVNAGFRPQEGAFGTPAPLSLGGAGAGQQ